MTTMRPLDVYAALFPKDSVSEEFKLLLIYAVWKAIKDSPGITKNKLEWEMEQQFSFTPQQVNTALTALSGSKMFYCVSKFKVPQSITKQIDREIVHLRPRKGQEKAILDMERSLLRLNPNLPSMVA